MTEQAQIQSVALFYFFAFLDEKVAFEATSKALVRLKNTKSLKEGEESLDQESEDPAATIVHLTNRHWLKIKDSKVKNPSAVSYEGGWLVPHHVDLGVWRDFKKESDADEFLAVLWSRVLGFSDDSISRGLGVTVGTVRYRVGRGLRLLGTVKLKVSRDGR